MIDDDARERAESVFVTPFEKLTALEQYKREQHAALTRMAKQRAARLEREAARLPAER